MFRMKFHLLLIGIACWLAIGLAHSTAEAQATAAQVVFANNTLGTITVHFIDAQNQEVKYNTLTAGQSYTQQAFFGNRWAIRNAQNVLLQTVTVNQVSQQVLISNPGPTPPPFPTTVSALTISNGTSAPVQVTSQLSGQALVTYPLVNANEKIQTQFPIGTVIVITNPITRQELMRKTMAAATESMNVASTPVIPPNPRPVDTRVEPKDSPAVLQLLQEMNQKRALIGLPALQLDDRISQLARDIVQKWTSGEIPESSQEIRGERANQRAASLRILFGGSTVIGENFQPTGTPESVVSTWMQHQNERNRMLGDFTLVGIGIASNNVPKVNYGVIFVKPAGSTTPVVPPLLSPSPLKTTPAGTSPFPPP